jgi:hypothetical protein
MMQAINRHKHAEFDRTAEVQIDENESSRGTNDCLDYLLGYLLAYCRPPTFVDFARCLAALFASCRNTFAMAACFLAASGLRSAFDRSCRRFDISLC